MEHYDDLCSKALPLSLRLTLTTPLDVLERYPPPPPPPPPLSFISLGIALYNAFNTICSLSLASDVGVLRPRERDYASASVVRYKPQCWGNIKLRIGLCTWAVQRRPNVKFRSDRHVALRAPK